MNTELQKQVVNLINQSKKILILPSSPPDGDSIGSALSLYLILTKLKKEVTVVCSDPIPDIYSFFPDKDIISDKFNASQDFIITLDTDQTQVDNLRYHVEQNKVNIVVTPKKGNFTNKNVSFHHGPAKYDLIITVDCAELHQLGPVYENHPDFFYEVPVINIDHHPSNQFYGKVNLVDITASSTTEILIPIIEDLSHQNKNAFIDEDIATLLLAGIITDTGSFQHSNTSPKSFALAAHLLDYGARQQEIIQHIYKTKPLSTLKLWGRVLSKLKYDEKHRLCWSSVTLQDLLETGSTHEEVGNIIDELLSNAPGAEVVLLIKEKSSDLVSVSVRTSNPSVDANTIAGKFGGGGHLQAAGFRIKNIPFDTAEQTILKSIREYQSKRLHLLNNNDNEEEDISPENSSNYISGNNLIEEYLPAKKAPPLPQGEILLKEALKNKPNKEIKKEMPGINGKKGEDLTVGDILNIDNSDQKNIQRSHHKQEDISTNINKVSSPSSSLTTTPEEDLVALGKKFYEKKSCPTDISLSTKDESLKTQPESAQETETKLEEAKVQESNEKDIEALLYQFGKNSSDKKS